jgi:hypothetical protein
VFTAADSFVCEIDDIAGTAITLKTQTNADGNFDVTWSPSDWQLEPVNGILDGLTVPFTRIRAVGDYLFPTLNANFGLEALVQLTAVYGWPSVPEPITQAVIIQASRIFKRYDSPLGVAGFGDLGAIRVTRALDPDVAQLVEPYRRMRMFARPQQSPNSKQDSKHVLRQSQIFAHSHSNPIRSTRRSAVSHGRHLNQSPTTVRCGQA